MQQGKCPECGKHFVPMSVNQIYCSRKCGGRYRIRHKVDGNYPPVTFTCSQCGREVTTEGGTGDKRTRFCSAVCEKKYWRHPPHDRPSTRTNFRSAAEYVSWERRTNE